MRAKALFETQLTIVPAAREVIEMLKLGCPKKSAPTLTYEKRSRAFVFSPSFEIKSWTHFWNILNQKKCTEITFKSITIYERDT